MNWINKCFLKTIKTLLLVFSFSFLHIPLSPAQEIKLPDVKSWGYQLQNVSIAEVRHSEHDLMVIDPVIDDGHPRIYSKSQVTSMKNIENAKQRKIVLAYLSIGEAEEYRSYWQQSWKKHPPEWLGTQNPEWKGNYKVRFWDNEWQTIMLKQVKRTMAAGFDGIYLDIVDAWEYWADEDTYKDKRELLKRKDPKGNNGKAADLMVDWIVKIAESARENSEKHVLIFPQNGEELLLYASEKNQRLYWKVIDGIGVEDVFHFGKNPEDNPLNVNQERLKILGRFPVKNKLVLSLEYLTEKRSITEYVKRARLEKFIPCVATRALDKPVIAF